jgi:DNA-directed RNA polymerase specialized sigma24 family protein
LDLPISTEDLARLYRFALLLTGDEVSAQQVFYDACMDCAARLGGYRNDDGRMACMIGSLRQKAKAAQPGGVEGRGPWRGFATLPEEERVALAGLYTGLLPARLLAETLKLSLEQMGRALKKGRERLARAGLELGEPSLEQAL